MDWEKSYILNNKQKGFENCDNSKWREIYINNTEVFKGGIRPENFEITIDPKHKRSTHWNNFLVGSWCLRLFGATVVATSILSPKIRCISKSIKIIILARLDEKWLSYGQKTYAHCPYMELLIFLGLFWPITWPNVNILY